MTARLRYVALGDSLSEGVGDDPWPDGTPRGWTDRLAQHLADHHGPIDYANVAVRGLKAGQVLETQLAPALAMEPDVVTLTAGMNDILRPGADLDELHATLWQLVEPLTANGARLVIVPIPDVSTVSPMGRLLDARRTRLNAMYADVIDRSGGEHLTDTTGTVFEDGRAWSDDRLHLSAIGHERLALAAAETLGLPISGWDAPLPEPAAARSLRTDLAWGSQHLLPWIGRRLTGRSSADGRAAKRPALAPFPA